MIKKILFFLLLFSSQSFGATDSIPVGTLISQLVNVSLLIALICFFQGKTVVRMLKDKRENFLKGVKDSMELKEKAQGVLAEVTERLRKMSETFDEKTREARENAQNSYQNQIKEAKAQALRLKEMVQRNFEFEIQKQVGILRKETFQKSSWLAEKEMKEKFNVEKLRAWNTHFLSGQRGE